jgi:hypothetical protein
MNNLCVPILIKTFGLLKSLNFSLKSSICVTIILDGKKCQAGPRAFVLFQEVIWVAENGRGSDLLAGRSRLLKKRRTGSLGITWAITQQATDRDTLALWMAHQHISKPPTHYANYSGGSDPLAFPSFKALRFLSLIISVNGLFRRRGAHFFSRLYLLAHGPWLFLIRSDFTCTSEHSVAAYKSFVRARLPD